MVITLNAQTFFPLEYYLVASGEAQRLGVGLYDWHRPSAAFFTGWQDIDASSIVDAGKVASLGWEGAVHLAPGRSLWLVTLVDPGYEFPLFSPLQSGDLREILRVDVQGGGLTAEIREAIPVDAQTDPQPQTLWSDSTEDLVVLARLTANRPAGTVRCALAMPGKSHRLAVGGTSTSRRSVSAYGVSSTQVAPPSSVATRCSGGVGKPHPSNAGMPED